MQITARNLAKADLFQQRTIATSNADVLSATLTGTPALGATTFTPLQAAQAHQVVSSGLATTASRWAPVRCRFASAASWMKA